jgi:hypothetical protein
MAKKFDYKQFLLTHGERIGLGVAGAVTLLILITSLFLSGRGFRSGSATEKAEEIEKTTKVVERALTDPNNKPQEKDKPPKDADASKFGLNKETVDSTKFVVSSLIPPDSSGSLGRRKPTVFPLDEAIAAADRVNVRTYIITGNEDKMNIMLLESEGGDKKGGPAAGGGAGLGSGAGLGGFGGGRGGSAGGPPGGMGGMDGRRGSGRSGMYGDPGYAGSTEGRKEKKPYPVPLNELEKHTDKIKAEQVRPRHVAVIAASFPYLKQLKEFQAKLGKPIADILAEASVEQGLDKSALPNFRFIGVQAERREVDGNGKPLTEFAAIDLGDYYDLSFLTGRRFEPEDPALAAVSFSGLVMHKLLQLRAEKPGDSKTAGPGSPGAPGSPGGPAGGKAGGGGIGLGGSAGPGGSGAGAPGAGSTPPAGDPAKDRYPKVENDLKLLKKTLDELKGKNPAQVFKPPPQFRRDRFDPFAADSGTPTDSNTDPSGAAPKSEGTEYPEYCLVRVVDYTIQPGKTYEYRLRVVMGNPNFGRKDVSNPTFALDKMISSEWYQVPTSLYVEPDLYYYAVDQKQLKNGDYKVANAGYNPRANEVVLQAHRYLPDTKLKGGVTLFVGEWSVSERFFAARGEYVGRNLRSEIPYWRYTLEDFTIAHDLTSTTRTPGIAVPFGYNANNPSQPEAILVDFDFGRVAYNRMVGRDEDARPKTINDSAANEVLLLNPDGKLFLLEGAEDARDESLRAKRLEAVRKRVKEVRDAGKETKEKKPFGK